MMRAIVTMVVILIFIVLMGIFFLVVQFLADDDAVHGSDTKADHHTNTAYKLSPVLEGILTKRVHVLRESLHEGDVTSVLSEYNERHKNYTDEDLLAFDEQWKNSQSSQQFIRDHLDARLSSVLEIFQENHPQFGFVEIFVTDLRGVNIAQSSMTSDYHQSDESWWHQAFQEEVSFGDVIEDESVGNIVLPISFVIHDEAQHAMGVVRVSVDMIAVRRAIQGKNL